MAFLSLEMIAEIQEVARLHSIRERERLMRADDDARQVPAETDIADIADMACDGDPGTSRIIDGAPMRTPVMTEPHDPAVAMTTLEGHIADVLQRRERAGIADDEATLDALRNKGHGRTESKKALLRACAARARAAGLEPLPAYIDGERI